MLTLERPISFVPEITKKFCRKLCSENNSVLEFQVQVKTNRSTLFFIFFEGYVADLNALDLGIVCWNLGAGRTKATDVIDHSVGLVLFKKPGMHIMEGDIWVEVLHSGKNFSDDLFGKVENAITISDQPCVVSSPILRII